MDTVKSRIQIKQATEQTSIFKMFVEVLKEEGVRGLYRGTCHHRVVCVVLCRVCRASCARVCVCQTLTVRGF